MTDTLEIPDSIPPFETDLTYLTEVYGESYDEERFRIPYYLRSYRIYDARDLCPHFEVKELDEKADQLKWASTPICPIHQLKLEGRDITVAEDPNLHLVTSYSKIYLKPLPPYLLVRDFWTFFQDAGMIKPAMLGFLRSWCRLIVHESDFIIAQKSHLVPKNINWDMFRQLSSEVLANVRDEDVSPRYERLGEVKLSRLNLAARFLFNRSSYATFSEPRRPINWPHFFIGLFALFSVILSGMQVVLAVEAIKPRYGEVLDVFQWTSLVFLLLFCIGFVGILALQGLALLQDWKSVRKATSESRRAMRRGTGLAP